ncbi:MAG: hypothetical protein RL071_3420 [Pseudomonadota bacterium]
MRQAPLPSPPPAPTAASPWPTQPYFVREVPIWPPVVLAPMEGVTDLTFRRLIRQIGGAGLTCTEFLPSEGLRQTGGQRGRIAWTAQFDDDERPISVQIYGKRPEGMAEAARIVEAMGATIVDINMGCPSKKVCSNSGGSSLMADMDLAIEIVRAVRAAVRTPLTVKMRSGFDHSARNAPELAWRCQEEGVDAVTIHWRTRADLYGGQRAVDKIAEARARLSIPVIGNGDVIDVESARRMFVDTGCAGVMVGRGAMRDPWTLLQIQRAIEGQPPVQLGAAEKERVLLGFLADLQARFLRESGALGRFKKVCSHFVRGLPFGEEALRGPLLRAESAAEAADHARRYFAHLASWEAGDPDAMRPMLPAEPPPSAAMPFDDADDADHAAAEA